MERVSQGGKKMLSIEKVRRGGREGGELVVMRWRRRRMARCVKGERQVPLCRVVDVGK